MNLGTMKNIFSIKKVKLFPKKKKKKKMKKKKK